MSYEIWTQQLRDAGYRLTRPRLAILRRLNDTDALFTVADLKKSLPRLDMVSMYRTMDLLSTLDIIHPVMTKHGQQRYELHGEDHHHHVVCSDCDRVACVPCIMPTVRQKQFTAIHHTLALTGKCVKCSANN